MAKGKGKGKGKDWTEIKGGSLINWDDEKAGKIIEGRLISVTTQKSKKGKKGVYKVFKIETKKGEVFAVTGSQLEDKLAGVKTGKEVRLVYKGKVKTSKGFKVNTFEVFVR